MDWHLIVAIAAGILSASSVIPYIRDMLKGSTRPNLVSWGLWFLIQGIFTAAQFSAGASFSIILPIMGVLAVFCVVVLGLFGYGYKKYGPLDFVCLALALSAILLWQITNDPVVALWLSLVADAVATIPTFFKAYRDPASETPLAYFVAIFAAIAAGLSSTIIDVPNLLWPVWIVVGNTFILSLLFLGQRRKHRK